MTDRLCWQCARSGEGRYGAMGAARYAEQAPGAIVEIDLANARRCADDLRDWWSAASPATGARSGGAVGRPDCYQADSAPYTRFDLPSSE